MPEPLSDREIDAELVRRAQAGDTEAFDELVMKYSKRIYGLVYNMTSHKEDTYDLMQDIFAKAYRSLKRFQGKSSFYTWIYSIAINMTINFLKKRKRRQAMSLDDVDNGIQNDEAFVDGHYQVNPRRSHEVKELQIKLNEAMQRLSEEHRAVVTMFDIQGMPHSEISKILGVSEGTVRSRLFYAHQYLQSFVSDVME